MIRYLISAVVAALMLFATFVVLSKAIGPGSPADVFIVGQLELLAERIGDPAEEAPRGRRPPERPKFETSTPE